MNIVIFSAQTLLSADSQEEMRLTPHFIPIYELDSVGLAATGMGVDAGDPVKLDERVQALWEGSDAE